MQLVLDYIERLSPLHQELMREVNNFLTSYPSIHTTVKYGLPFYEQHKVICYVNPQKKGGIEVMFWHAKKMTKNGFLLDPKDRKRMEGYTVNKLTDEAYEHLDMLMQEAMEIDKELNAPNA